MYVGWNKGVYDVDYTIKILKIKIFVKLCSKLRDEKWQFSQARKIYAVLRQFLFLSSHSQKCHNSCYFRFQSISIDKQKCHTTT